MHATPTTLMQLVLHCILPWCCSLHINATFIRLTLVILPSYCSAHLDVAKLAFLTLLLLGPPCAQLFKLLFALAAWVAGLGEDVRGNKAAEKETRRSKTNWSVASRWLQSQCICPIVFNLWAEWIWRWGCMKPLYGDHCAPIRWEPRKKIQQLTKVSVLYTGKTTKETMYTGVDISYM